MGENDPKVFLEELNKEKKKIEKYIKQLEESIKINETNYLQNTLNGGNILRGWEHIFTSKSNKVNMGNQPKNRHISDNEKLFSQTFELDKNSLEEINTNEKNINQSSNNVTNNIKLDSPKANSTITNTNNHRHKKSIKQSLRLKRKRNNDNDSNQNDKSDIQKNS